MTEACIRRRLLCALLSSWLLAGCSGSRDDALNTHNIGRADSAVLSDEDAGDEEPLDEGDAGEQGSELDGAAPGEVDAGDFDAIVSVEVADAGDAPDTTVVVETLLCGNGASDPGEDCDQGANNSDTLAGACRTNCRNARCSDGVVDQGEVCDRGAMNSDSEANACRTSCTAARCGDNVVDQGEQCDSGDARSNTAAGACRLDCRSARCGDSVVDNDEGCDDGNSVDNDMCRNTCRTLLCGNQVVDPGEQCDDGNTTNGDGCQATCRTPRCGDRVMDPGEQCDDGNSVENDGCRANCQNGCVNDAACSDGLFCTGTERCVNGLCNPGTGVNPDDGVACTVDVCREDLDRVTHTANDALCDTPAPTCTGGRGTVTTATCNVTGGCSRRQTTTTCTDEASACEMRGDGSYTLVTYAPSCEDGMSCGDANQSTRVCAHIPASCSTDRVFTGRASATCNPNAESCGNSAPTVSDCKTRDASSCAAGNTSFTRMMGTCGTGGCGTTTSGPTACSDPADTCANAVRRTYDPSCSTSAGCGTPIATDTPCTDASPAGCGSFGPNGQAALRTYQPACDAARPGQCSTTGAVQSTTVCTPRVASTCDNTSTRVPRETTYAPACNGATACSATGAGTSRDCVAPTDTSCGPTGVRGAPQVTSHVPACNADLSACLTGGRDATRDCDAAGPSCGLDGQRAVRTTYRAACNAAGTDCMTNGQGTPVYCDSAGITCSGSTANLPANSCTNGVCDTTPQNCAALTIPQCVLGNVVTYTGSCLSGTGCQVSSTRACNTSFCGASDGVLLYCPGGCSAGPNGAACNTNCSICNGSCRNGICIGGIGSVGNVGDVGSLDPGTTPPTGPVLR